MLSLGKEISFKRVLNLVKFNKILKSESVKYIDFVDLIEILFQRQTMCEFYARIS